MNDQLEATYIDKKNSDRIEELSKILDTSLELDQCE